MFKFAEKKIILFLIVLMSLLNGASLFATEDPVMPGRIEGTGNYFEITDSEYLNIALESSEEIKVILESSLEIVNMELGQALSVNATTEITFSGFLPNTTYHKYEDNYHNHVVFITDSNGRYSYVQDLSSEHFIFIQQRSSTKFIKDDEAGGDCTSIGSWSPETKTCTLATDLNETIQIDSDNITLDGNNHSINGSWGSSGIYLPGRSGVTLKNLNIQGFSWGIRLSSSNFNTFIDNSILNNGFGVYLSGSGNNMLSNNDISLGSFSGIDLYYSNGNILDNNKVSSNNRYGISLSGSSNNAISNNNILLNNGSGIFIESSNDNIFSDNDVSNNGWQGIFMRNSIDNKLIGNNISLNSDEGIFMTLSDNNRIYHNNFIDNNLINNLNQAYDSHAWDYGVNFWDNGAGEGNYWSDYFGADLNGDGIGDVAYNIYDWWSEELTAQDNYPFMEENGWDLPQEPENWSFAQITDLHIGRGYPDYDGAGYATSGEGEDYYLTERLERVVNWINDNKNDVDCDDGVIKCPIKFVAVLGDITDSGEKSEYLKAQSILNVLNDPNNDGDTSDGIPYVPVFGNHDVWPYTNATEAGSALGEDYFEKIFWDENATNTILMKERLNFIRDEANPDYKNFTLKYGDINFIGLDFNSRNPTFFGSGVGSDAVLFGPTRNWLTNQLDEVSTSSIILLSHHPFINDLFSGFSSNELTELKIIIENKNVLAGFSGHIHGFEKFLGLKDIFMDANKSDYPTITTSSVITTEALMVSGNEQDISNKGVIIIVKVEDDAINASTTEGKFSALNPYISFDFTASTNVLPCVFFKAHLFTKRNYSLVWDFDDGGIGSDIWQTHCYSEAGIYNVKLTGIDEETGKTEHITRQIEVKEGIIPWIIKIPDALKDTVDLISTELDQKVTEFGRTMKDVILVLVHHSPAVLAGAFTAHFEEATTDIDLTTLIADTNSNTKKSILYMPEWPDVIEAGKILFIPK